MNRRFAFLFALGASVAVIAACSLNPQPLPPDNFDASGGGGDGATTTFGDSGAAPDSGFDYDASTDSPTGIIDAAPDADLDASDATATDASSDASSDAREE